MSVFGNQSFFPKRAAARLLSYNYRILESTNTSMTDPTTENSLSKMAASVKGMHIIENNTISGVIIRKTILRNCVLRHVELHTSTITDSSLEQCEIYNCSIDNSTAEDSKLHECNWRELQTHRCIVSTSPLALRRFPPEIRTLILQRCMDYADRRTPAIILALRGDPELYQEAIRLFYKLNWLRIDHYPLSFYDSVPRGLANKIEKLSIR
jgi:hypothetical protein